MTYTHDGVVVPHEWMPLAVAEGVRWRQLVRITPSIRDRSLYRRGYAPLCWGLWWSGWIVGYFYRPRWAQPEGHA